MCCQQHNGYLNAQRIKNTCLEFPKTILITNVISSLEMFSWSVPPDHPFVPPNQPFVARRAPSYVTEWKSRSGQIREARSGQFPRSRGWWKFESVFQQNAEQGHQKNLRGIRLMIKPRAFQSCGNTIYHRCSGWTLQDDFTRVKMHCVT